MKKFHIAKARRLRGTPYSSRIESQGLTVYTTYNHMLLPASFEGTEKDYFHLKENVQVWDVAAQRQVQILGKDSAKLVQLMGDDVVDETSNVVPFVPMDKSKLH